MVKPEKTIASQQIYRGHAVSIRVDTVEKAGGRKTKRDVVEHSDCIAVVALDEQNNILLVRQFRYPVGRFLLEIPAGGIDPGEEPIDSVRRELQDLHCFVATDLVPGRLTAEDTEDIELVRVSQDEIPQLIHSGEICDAKSIAALLMFLFYAAR